MSVWPVPPLARECPPSHGVCLLEALRWRCRSRWCTFAPGGPASSPRGLQSGARALETFTAETPVPGLPAKFPRGKTPRVALSGGMGAERWRRRRVTPSERFTVAPGGRYSRPRAGRGCAAGARAGAVCAPGSRLGGARGARCGLRLCPLRVAQRLFFSLNNSPV